MVQPRVAGGDVAADRPGRGGVGEHRSLARVGVLAERALGADGLLFLYGPFREAGRHTGAGNEAFDADPQARYPLWGIRDLDEIAALAGQYGFGAPERVAMPANNLRVVFRRC
jgi:hypothetical protein